MKNNNNKNYKEIFGYEYASKYSKINTFKVSEVNELAELFDVSNDNFKNQYKK